MNTSVFNTFRRLSPKEFGEQDLQLAAVVFKNDCGVWGTKRYHYYIPASWGCASGDLVCVEAPAGNRDVKITEVFDTAQAIKRINATIQGFKTAKWVVRRKLPPTAPSFDQEFCRAAGRLSHDPYLDFKFTPVPSPATAYSHQIDAYAQALGLKRNGPLVNADLGDAELRVIDWSKGLSPSQRASWSKALWDAARNPILTPDNPVFNRIKPQEPAPMNLTITHQTLINGQNVEHLSDADLFGVIKRAQDEIANLEKIAPDNRPRRLVKRIDELQAGIKSLVALLDERDTKSESKE